MEIARVANQLYKRNKRKDLSVMEKKLYEQAYQLLVNEISLSKNITQDEAQDMISQVLN
jgi:CarD family transcriptional regulator